MVNEWLDAIADLLLTAPGNTDEELGPVWDSTLTRLNEASTEDAVEKRVFDEYHEAENDASEARPFFVVREFAVDWQKYDATFDLAAHGVIEVAYTEQTLTAEENEDQPVDHKTAVRHFRHWTSQLIQSCAERARQAGVPIAAIRQVVFPQRTSREQRNPDKPGSDYCWACWHFVIGEAP